MSAEQENDMEVDACNIFDEATNNDDLAEQSTSSENLTSMMLLTKLPKQRRGRPKKNPDPQVIYNEDRTSQCMVCNQNIEEEMWKCHNAKSHYNLAWRYGEMPLDLTDESVVMKCLNNLKNFSSKKLLNCNKCKFKSSSPKVFLNHLDTCYGIVNSEGMVTCAICQAVLKNAQFVSHKVRSHNNLAWRVGDQPLDLNDQRFVMSILKKLHKLKKVLYCDQCGVAKKSVVGLLSHQMICQKSQTEVDSIKVECTICGSKVLPASYDIHLKMHGGKKTNKNHSEDLIIDNKKRDAAQKALSIIDSNLSFLAGAEEDIQYYVTVLNFDEPSVLNNIENELQNKPYIKCKYKNCPFWAANDSTTAANFIEHLKTCKCQPSNPQCYVCKMCMAIRQYEHEMIAHMKQTHRMQNAMEDDFEFNVYREDDSEGVSNSRGNSILPKDKKKTKLDNSDIARVKPACISGIKKSVERLFPYVYQWYIEFTDEHFSKDKLFPYLDNSQHYKILDDEVLEYYFPQHLKSCNVSFKTIKHNTNFCKETPATPMQLFQVEYNEGYFTIFCGGPICAMSWIPTDCSNCNQILAVSILPGMDDKYRINSTYEETTAIQFWNFGKLRNKEVPDCKPELMFAMAVDFGPVWHLEWCPSGCYNIKDGRLGLLAAAGSDSLVHLFAIPNLDDKEQGIFLKNKPVAVLQLQENCNKTLFATRISWSKASGHKYVAVGYTSGIIAIYHLHKLCDEPLETNITKVLYPLKMFQAHLSAITALAFKHLSGGGRWLFSGSADRETCIWDLENSEKLMSSKKGLVTDGLWMINWLNCMTCYDENSALLLNISTTSHTFRDFLTESVNLTHSTTTISALDASDCLNIVMQGNIFGELLAVPVHQMLYAFDSEKTLRQRRCLFGYVTLQNRSEKGSNATTLYSEVENDYNVVFVDYKLDSFNDFPRGNEESGNANSSNNNQTFYSIQKINKISCNPNLQSSTFFAVGYQAGFVRVSTMHFLRNDVQVFSIS